MPNMNGLELCREIKKVDDKVKVCFITAFEEYYEELKKRFQISVASDKEEDVKFFIRKPIGIDNLVKRIKEELTS
jgi:response regulator RpfG family c-di-GMP phosphodiesterase